MAVLLQRKTERSRRFLKRSTRRRRKDREEEKKQRVRKRERKKGKRKREREDIERKLGRACLLILSLGLRSQINNIPISSALL